MRPHQDPLEKSCDAFISTHVLAEADQVIDKEQCKMLVDSHCRMGKRQALPSCRGLEAEENHDFFTAMTIDELEAYLHSIDHPFTVASPLSGATTHLWRITNSLGAITIATKSGIPFPPPRKQKRSPPLPLCSPPLTTLGASLPSRASDATTRPSHRGCRPTCYQGGVH